MVMKKSGFLLLLFAGVAYATESQQSFYDYLNQVLIKGTPIKQTKPKKLEKKSPVKPEDLAVKLPKELDQKLLFVQLLQNEYPEKTFGTVLDQAGIESLELASRCEHFAALSRAFGVRTLFGDVMLTSLLACPLTDVAAIKQRQAFVRSIGSHTRILTEL